MGIWTEIVEIVAPGQAEAGESVGVAARVKNLGSYGFYVAVTGVFNGTTIPFTPDYAGIDSGAIHSFAGSFIMPEKPVRVTVGTWYWAGSEWIQDDTGYIDIDLGGQQALGFSQFEIADYSRV